MNYEYNNMTSKSYTNMPVPPVANEMFEDGLYPEVYRKLFPICEKIINEMELHYGNITLDNEVLDMMTDEAVKRSGYITDAMDDNSAAVPAVAYPHHHRRGYDRHSLKDLSTILLLQMIFGTHRRPRWRRKF